LFSMPHVKRLPGASFSDPISRPELAVVDAVRPATEHQVCVSRAFADVHRSRERADPARRSQVFETEPANLAMYRLACGHPPHAVVCQSERPQLPGRGPAGVADRDTLSHSIRFRLCRRHADCPACARTWHGDPARHAACRRDTVQASVCVVLSERFRQRGGDRARHDAGIGLGGGVASWH